MATTTDLVDIFFPNPRQVIVVRSWGYEVGDLHAPGIHSLSLAQRKVQVSWFHGLRIRWRIGVREGMAFLSREGLHWIRAHSVRTGPTLRLPGGVEISFEMRGLSFHKLCVQKGAERIEIDFRTGEYWFFVFSPQNGGLWGGAWIKKQYSRVGISADLEILSPGHGRRYAFEIPGVVWQWGLDSPLAVGPGVLAVLVPPRQIWAARMGQNALHLIAQEERGVLKTVALSPKGRYLVALRQERGQAAWLGWRWDGRTFIPEWEVEMPPLPEEGDVRISPDLRWIVLVGSRVWAIPAPGIPARSAKPVREAVRKIFPVEVSHESDPKRSS
jgi:hypothetical protein